MKKQPKASVPCGNGWPGEHGRGREPDEDRFTAWRALPANSESESTDGGHPPERPDDAECEWRSQTRPVSDHLEDALLLNGRQVSCVSRRKAGGDPGNRVVGAEEDEEDSDTKARHPGVRAPVAVRE